MHSGISFNRFPTGNECELRRLLECFHQDPALHVLADWNSEQSKNCGRNIEEAGAVYPFVALNGPTAHGKNAKRPVPDRRPARDVWSVPRPEQIRMEAVVGQ